MESEAVIEFLIPIIFPEGLFNNQTGQKQAKIAFSKQIWGE
jgi:hypothetical protein